MASCRKSCRELIGPTLRKTALPMKGARPRKGLRDAVQEHRDAAQRLNQSADADIVMARDVPERNVTDVDVDAVVRQDGYVVHAQRNVRKSEPGDCIGRP